jgi:flagellar basal-body rod protein FlgF
MSNGIYTALSGAVAQNTALDVVANNVSNAQTTGYKAQRASFGEVLSSADGGSFVGVTRTQTDDSAGAVVQTGNPLDVALDGEGYFAVETNTGPRYTRAGSFRVDSQGVLVTNEGNAVRGQTGGQILVPPEATDLTISANGMITGMTPGDVEPTEIGQLELVRIDSNQLVREGASLFRAKGAIDTDAPPPTVMSGHLEASNFDSVRGMVDLVRVSRTYDSLHRMIESYRQLDQRTAREVGGSR